MLKRAHVWVRFKVEMAGIEPASENSTLGNLRA